MTKKYEFTGETMVHEGVTLRQIRATGFVNPASQVRPGSLGGWIESEYNLSQEGTCWIGKSVKVWGGAKIIEEAQVCSNDFEGVPVEIYDGAIVGGRSILGTYSHTYRDIPMTVRGNVKVTGQSFVLGNPHIEANPSCGDSVFIGENAVIQGSPVITSGYIISPFGPGSTKHAISCDLEIRIIIDVMKDLKRRPQLDITRLLVSKFGPYGRCFQKYHGLAMAGMLVSISGLVKHTQEFRGSVHALIMSALMSRVYDIAKLELATPTFLASAMRAVRENPDLNISRWLLTHSKANPALLCDDLGGLAWYLLKPKWEVCLDDPVRLKDLQAAFRVIAQNDSPNW